MTSRLPKEISHDDAPRAADPADPEAQSPSAGGEGPAEGIDQDHHAPMGPPKITGNAESGEKAKACKAVTAVGCGSVPREVSEERVAQAKANSDKHDAERKWADDTKAALKVKKAERNLDVVIINLNARLLLQRACERVHDAEHKRASGGARTAEVLAATRNAVRATKAELKQATEARHSKRAEAHKAELQCKKSRAVALQKDRDATASAVRTTRLVFR